ncbi:MAG: HTH domain-containing protein [Salinirussus sp.]
MTTCSDKENTNRVSEEHETGLTATLYLRCGMNGAVGLRQETLRDRFDELRRSDRVADAMIERWERTIETPLDDDDPRSEAAETYRQLVAAVEAAGGRLEPFFEVEERDGGLLVGPRPGQRISFPVSCLEIRRRGTITGVYPCWLGDRYYSVDDGLVELESGDPENLR